MNTVISATYFDGEILRGQAVGVALTDDRHLRITGGPVDLRIPAAQAQISDQLGSIPFFLRLSGRGMLEIPASDEAAAFLDRLRPFPSRTSLIHRLESHATVAAAATLLLAGVVAVSLWLGLPRLARRAAYAVPAEIELQAGKAGYAAFAQSFLPSNLGYYEKERVRHALGRLKQARTLHLEPKVVFFQMNAPNAFALPGGTIVVTDELVRLALNEDELAAVLAHELGHVELRHGLQSVLRNSSALIVVSTVTGDLSTLSTFSGTLPFILLQYGYSREFEREADAFAVDLLRDAHINPVALASILQRLEEKRPTHGTDFSYLSTHPGTEERVKFIRSFGPTLATTVPPRNPAPSLSFTGTLPPAPSMSVLKWNAGSFPAKVPAMHSTTSTIPGGDTGPLDLSMVERVPRALSQPPPHYPAAMRHAGIPGVVVVDFIVDRDGAVRIASVLSSSRHEFDQSALEAVQQWLFEPGLRNGVPVRTHMQVPIQFEADSSPSSEHNK